MKKFILSVCAMFFAVNANAIPAMGADTTAVKKEKQVENNSILKPIKVQILKWNMWINKQIPKYMKSLKNSPNFMVVFTALFAAFIYGIIHTMGPGHGKMVVATYFLTQDAKFMQGVWLGVKTAFAHVAGAVVLVFTTDIALRSVVMNPETHMYLLRNISFSLIILVGTFILIQAILHATGKIKSSGCSHCNHVLGHDHSHHHHNHSHDEHNHTVNASASKKENIIALSIGSIPCTGSLLILLYAMSHDIMFFGLLMVFFVALGISVAMIMLGVITIFGKKKVVDRFFEKSKHAHKSKIVIEVLGALFIILLGALLLWANLN